MQKTRAEKPAEHKAKPSCPKRRKGCFPVGMWEVRGSGSPGPGRVSSTAAGRRHPRREAAARGAEGSGMEEV